MTVEEFSNEFDILASSYRRFKALDQKEELDSLEFNEYEKSVYLTKAQEQIVKELYLNQATGESFESNEQLRRELEQLVTQLTYTESTKGELLNDNKYNHTSYILPENCLYIVYEQVSWDSEDKCLSSKIADVYPVTHDEYWRIRNNPFRGPNSKRVLRLDNGNRGIELISNGTIGEYIIRYLRKPEPIILTTLPDETIDGINTPQTCKLSESIHRNILERAVRLALTSKAINSKDKGEK